MIQIVTGNKCRACGGLLTATDGDDYVCSDCGMVHEITDMYMP